MIAFAAMAALQEPRFVAAVRADHELGNLARRLAADPQTVLLLPGGEAAAARASGALYAQGSALIGEGEKVKRAAYSVQHQAWARTKVLDPAGRLSRVKHISTGAYEPNLRDAGRAAGQTTDPGWTPIGLGQPEWWLAAWRWRRCRFWARARQTRAA